MLIIYSENITTRLQYIVAVFFEQIFNESYRITNNIEEYKAFAGPKINYAAKKIDSNEIFIAASGLLLLNEIDYSLNATVEILNNLPTPILFKTANQDAVFPFDIFSASFFLITRYEEYLPFTPDIFERFEATESLAYKNNFLNLPLINIWAKQLKEIIEKKFPSFKITENTFKSTITIDIDQAYAFKHRGIYRNFIALIKNIIQLNGKQLIAQINSLFNIENDPNDSFNYLSQIQTKYHLPFIYFFNVGKYSRYDKNLSTKNKYQQQLIQQIQQTATIGIHPSYFSNKNNNFLENEIDALSKISNQPIVKSRQHFIRLFFPDTYRRLLHSNIRNDYSMGYASRPGFRASICTPFYWFDLQKNETTNLLIHPFTFMEGSFAEDLKMFPDDAWLQIETLIETVKNVNGHFITIWHNHTLNNKNFWKGWRNIFEKTLTKISEQ